MPQDKTSMTTAPTDTGKRLSDAELAEIASLHKLENAKGSTAWRNWHECNEQRAKLLSHIAALTAPPSQGKVERAREIAVDIVAKNMIRGEAVGPAYVVKLCIAAITQALTEFSGQGTDGAEEMREAAALHCDHEVDTYTRLAERYGDDDNDSAMHDCVVILGRFKSAAKAIRALPLPVSADGKYVTVLRQELLDLLLFVGQMDSEDAEMGQDFFDLIARLKEIATPQSKQPDTGAGK